MPASLPLQYLRSGWPQESVRFQLALWG